MAGIFVLVLLTKPSKHKLQLLFGVKGLRGLGVILCIQKESVSYAGYDATVQYLLLLGMHCIPKRRTAA